MAHKRLYKLLPSLKLNAILRMAYVILENGRIIFNVVSLQRFRLTPMTLLVLNENKSFKQLNFEV